MTTLLKHSGSALTALATVGAFLTHHPFAAAALAFLLTLVEAVRIVLRDVARRIGPALGDGLAARVRRQLAGVNEDESPPA